MKTPTEYLPCELLPHELRTKTLEHTAKLNAIDKLERELDAIKKDFKSRIEREEFDERHLREIVETGIEHRDVAIEFRPNFDDNTMETYRLDTLAFVRSRPLEKEERQIMLFSERKDAGEQSA